MLIRLLIIFLLTSCLSGYSYALDPFSETEELEDNPEIKNNPALQDFLNPDESPESRKVKPVWQKFKAAESGVVNYVPPSSRESNPEGIPNKPSEYKSDPFADRIEYLENNLGLSKPQYPGY